MGDAKMLYLKFLGRSEVVVTLYVLKMFQKAVSHDESKTREGRIESNLSVRAPTRQPIAVVGSFLQKRYTDLHWLP
jgi:hypothetical protein